MSHWDISIAFKQAIPQALNVTQGHEPSYQSSSKLIYTKYRGTISAHMFQRGLNYSKL